ncbi:MAG TPA: NTF2-like N-terminal transpeptidase domain-containing protein, partial [Sporichthya sp.]|nr:NTF2-like N-terminal transpeptidase domain-containing protein [Sporichthya sp.]
MPRTPLRSAAAVLAAALLISGCGVFGGADGGGGGGGGGPRGVAEGFLAEWAAARFPDASKRTTDPAAAVAALTGMQDALRVDKREFSPGDLSGNCEDSNGCRLEFDVGLQLNGFGEWRYASALQLVRSTTGGDAEWKVRWAPTILHPRMTASTSFSRVRALPPRAPILDRADRPLVSQEPVVRVGIRAGSVPDGAIENLATLTNVNVDGLITRVAKADPGDFVEAVVLRNSDFLEMKPEIDKI